MQHRNRTNHWIKRFTVIWLVVAVQFGVVSSLNADPVPTETLQQFTSAGSTLNLEYLHQESPFPDWESTLNLPPSYLTLVEHELVVHFTLPLPLPLPLWPDESRLTFWFSIVSYQHFISSLGNLF